MLTIAWDVDDVLNDLMQCWFNDFKQSNCSCEVCYQDLIQNPPHEILKMYKNDYLNSLDEFRLSGKFLEMIPNPEILSFLEEKGQHFKHIALTATALKTAPNSAYWTTKHFGKWITSFNFVAATREGENRPVYYENKQEFLKYFQNVDILIDDSPDNIEQAQAIGVKGILISRPWNKGGYTIKEALGVLNEILKDNNRGKA